MPVTDPISDMLTRIRNAIMAGHDSVPVPLSKMKESLSEILKNEGFIEGTAFIGGARRKPTSESSFTIATGTSLPSAD